MRLCKASVLMYVTVFSVCVDALVQRPVRGTTENLDPAYTKKATGVVFIAFFFRRGGIAVPVVLVTRLTVPPPNPSYICVTYFNLKPMTLILPPIQITVS